MAKAICGLKPGAPALGFNLDYFWSFQESDRMAFRPSMAGLCQDTLSINLVPPKGCSGRQVLIMPNWTLSGIEECCHAAVKGLSNMS
jgi:hypothetical protein